MRRRAVLVLAALLLAGCGSSPPASPAASASAPTTPFVVPSSSSGASAVMSPAAPVVGSEAVSPTPSPGAPGVSPSGEPAGTAPSVGGFRLPDTPVTAVIDQAYNTTGDPFDPADLGGVRPGDVTARWYLAEDRWVVHLHGLDPRATGPLCPGTSAQTAAGFEHVSNAPTDAGACEGFDATLAAGPVGVRRCGGEVLYLTAIPADVEGMLFASIETRYQTEGSVVGLTGVVDPADGEPPEIDLDGSSCEVVPTGP